MQVVCSLPTAAIAAQYACSFGAELALNSILGSYYAENFPPLGQTKCGQWAAMFGLLNVVFRPLGGFISDVLYRHTQSIWAKKLWLIFLGVITRSFLIAVGVSDPKSQATMFGLFAGTAFFLEAANGANFSLVPHVYPAANGKLSLQNLLSRSMLTSIQELFREPSALRETLEGSSLISSSGIMGCIMPNLSG
jgi:NNP family nitrate/nitrite transporter-like MFS transporter